MILQPDELALFDIASNAAAIVHTVLLDKTDQQRGSWGR
jgi:hypothetical protein